MDKPFTPHVNPHMEESFLSEVLKNTRSPGFACPGPIFCPALYWLFTDRGSSIPFFSYTYMT